MLVLFLHFHGRDADANVVHVDHGRLLLRVVGVNAEGRITFVVTAADEAGGYGRPAVVRVRRHDVFFVGKAQVRVIRVSPAGVKVGIEAPRDVLIQRAKVTRKQRAEGRRR